MSGIEVKENENWCLLKTPLFGYFMQRHAVRSLSIGNNSTVFYNDRYLDGQVFVLFAKGPSMSFYPIFISSLSRCNQDNIVIILEQ